MTFFNLLLGKIRFVTHFPVSYNDCDKAQNKIQLSFYFILIH